MVKEYYYTIKDPQEFLKYYSNSYKGDYKKGRARKIISLFPELKGKRILEVGCGGGYYSLAASEKGVREITLVDISHVRVKGAKLNLLENANFFCNGIATDATNLPFKNGYFDFILLIDLVEHIKEDEAFLNEIRRVLQSGGLLVIATQNCASFNYFLEAPIQRYVLKNRNWMGWDTTHIRFYSPQQLHQLLKNCGLRVISTAGTYFIPYLFALWFRGINKKISEVAYQALYKVNQKLEQNNTSITNLFGWGIICLCQKG
jgi:2-polyprenyl-6-hydroxyphenyl methylase/3-demethylubiquinone-9 3-methyltransferase